MIKAAGKPRILIAPLDWGLGHTTRCIPIIRHLLALECDTWLAGEGNQAALLKAEFPLLTILPLAGYRIRYSGSGKSLIWKLLIQIPKILKTIRAEQTWLKVMVAEYEFDAVISDNRYGLYHSAVPCIFITHQLAVKTPFGSLVDNLIRKWNYRFINRFTGCWIPDLQGKNNLAGTLSHPAVYPAVPVRYIGFLSRFEHQKKSSANNNNLLIILSGPEPQRSIFEEMIIKQISHYQGIATVVRGLPESGTMIPSTNMIKFYNHLPSVQLEKEFEVADIIISRSGYSSIMDIVATRKKSIMIPTPGQTEQEYLAAYLMGKKIILSISQDNFILENALQQADQFSYQLPDSTESQIDLTDFLQQFNSANSI